MADFSFSHPWCLLFLLLLPLLLKGYIKTNQQRQVVMKVPSLKGLGKIVSKGRVRNKMWPAYLRLAAIALLIIAFSGPQMPLGRSPLQTDGIDIVLSMDVSSSMLAMDFEPDRLKAAKTNAKDFIGKRPDDRIGLVIFAGESYTLCPLTVDHGLLLFWLDQLGPNILEDGTAIGMGLSTAVNRLEKSVAKSKVIILLTDGENNSGYIDPETAMELAKAKGIRVYTIGIGTIGKAKAPFMDPITGEMGTQLVDVKIDEPLLKKIASETGGVYYRAVNNKSLSQIYNDIDRLEKSKIDAMAFKPKKELFYIFVGLALLLLMIEFIFKHLYLKTLH